MKLRPLWQAVLSVEGITKTLVLLIVSMAGSGEGISNDYPGSDKGIIGDITEELVGHWAFDEGEGEIAYDQSPFANDGILNNGPGWIQGSQNGAIFFDGSDDYIDCANGPSISVLGATFTISFRMRTTARETSEYLLYKGGLTTGFYLRTHSDNRILFKLDDGTNEVYRSSDTTAPTNGEWHHVVALVNGRESIQLYVDGILQTLGWGDVSLIGDLTNTNTLTLGGTPADPNGHFLGEMDDLRIYNRVLDLTEILYLLSDWVPPEDYTPTPAPPTPTPTPTFTPLPDGEIPLNAHYVRPPGGSYGAEDGSDWANAFDGLPTNLQRGWTYYLADGFYPGRHLSTPVSGTQKIQLFKATVQDHGTNVGWTSTMGDGITTFTSQLNFWTANWVLDGRRRNNDWRSGYGILIDTTEHKGIQIIREQTDNVTIRHVEFIGRGDDGAASPANDTIYITAPVTGFRLERCYLHDTGRTFLLLRGADDGIVENCYFARNESTAAQHAEGISAFAGTDRWTIRNNVWEDIDGTGIVMFAGNFWQIHGNICFNSGTRPGTLLGNGSFSTWTGLSVTGTALFNNTFIELTGAAGFYLNDNNPTAVNAGFNNIWYRCEHVDFQGTGHDFNWFYDSEEQHEMHAQHGSGNPFVDLENRNFNLAIPTQPGLAIDAVEFQVDPVGRVRGGDGSWDRGALEFGDTYLGSPGNESLSSIKGWDLYQ